MALTFASSYRSNDAPNRPAPLATALPVGKQGVQIRTLLLPRIRSLGNNPGGQHRLQHQKPMVNEERPPARHGVVGIVIRDGRLLVIRRSLSVEAPGAYCFPGGAIEEGETEDEALRREFQEELGVSVEPVRRVWRSQTDWNVDLSWWLAILPEHASCRPNQEEVDQTHWLTIQEIRELPNLLSSNRRFLDAFRRGDFAM